MILELSENGLPLFEIRPIENVPTMSEWGLIVMAGIFGIIGIIALRKPLFTGKSQ